MENVNKVSLITTLFNEANNILNFLESYKNQTKYADEFIIVDGGSTDGTINIIEQYANKNQELYIKVIVDKTCSKKYTTGPIAKGRNIAIENAKYNFIAVTDAGCILDKHWFEEISKPFEYDSVDVVAGWYEANAINDFQKKYAEIFMLPLAKIDASTFLPSSRSIAFKKSCWEKVDKYPEDTYTAEDTKFDLDLKEVGCKFVFVPKAVVFWDCPFDMKEAKQKHFAYAFGDGQHKIFFKSFLFGIIKIVIPYKMKRYFKLKYELNLSSVHGYISGLLKGKN